MSLERSKRQSILRLQVNSRLTEAPFARARRCAPPRTRWVVHASLRHQNILNCFGVVLGDSEPAMIM